MINEFHKISKQIVKCSSKQLCRQQCQSMDADSPEPGFIGRNYQGIVIVAANPGTGGHREYYQRMNKIYYSLADNFANSDNIADYHKYLDFLADYMRNWNEHLCNQKYRDLLNFDVEDIAYVNIVKCRTLITGSDVFNNCGKPVVTRCAEAYLLRQLEILKPKCILGHWKPIGNSLKRLGYDLSQVHYASNSGQRNLTTEERIQDIKTFFHKFAA